MNRICLLMVGVCLAFTACTKNPPVALGPDGKPMISAANEEITTVIEAMLEVPKELAPKVKKTDLLIWDVKNSDGEILVNSVTPVPVFPHKVTVVSRQLRRPIARSAPLLFSARVVHAGEESQPPKQAQLQANLGVAGEDKVVENPHVNQKVFEAWMKKNKIELPQEVKFGMSLTAELRPLAF